MGIAIMTGIFVLIGVVVGFCGGMCVASGKRVGQTPEAPSVKPIFDPITTFFAPPKAKSRGVEVNEMADMFNEYINGPTQGGGN